MIELQTFVVSRSRWLRGKGSAHSWLLESGTGHMCCLGFFCRDVLKLSEKKFAGLKEPKDLPRYGAVDVNALPDALKPLLFEISNVHNSDLARELMSENDNKSITDEVRELRLTELFLRMRIRVEFVD